MVKSSIRARTRASLASCALLVCVASTGAAAAPSYSMKAPRAVEWSEFLGMNVQFHWFEQDKYRQQMDKLRELNLKWVRLGLNWDTVEPKAGTWRWNVLDPVMQSAEEKGLKSLVYLVGSAPFATSAPAGVSNPDQYPPSNPQVYAQSLATLAQRYPDVAAWQVWNEQNLPSFWAPNEDPAKYVDLLNVSLRALEQVSPDSLKVMGGTAYYSQMPVRGGLMFESLIQHKAINKHLVSAYHPYSHEPEGDVPGAGDFIQNGDTLNRLLRQNGSGQIWATEFGWSSYSGEVEYQKLVGTDGQADYMLRRLALMSAMDYDRIFLFALSDLDARATLRDRSYGLLDINGQEKPAFKALKRFLTVSGPRLTPIDAPRFASAPKGMISIAWKREDGSTLWWFWAQEPGTVQLASKSAVKMHNPLTGEQQTLPVSSGKVRVAVSRQLQMIEM